MLPAQGGVIHAYESQSGFELTFREMKHIKQSDAYGKYRSVAYEGQQKDISAHVKGKGSKKGESLRVHFFADYRLRKIVIAHCGGTSRPTTLRRCSDCPLAHFSFADFALRRRFLASMCYI